jgi:hypothetical protein
VTGPGVPPGYFTTPSLARIYEYWLGGKDNYAPDREAAQMLTERCPGMRTMATENRRFILDAVKWTARRGVRQFLDLGCGRPPWPSVHDAARSVIPDAAVAYVDRDPVVVLHAAALEATAPGLAALEADVRDVRDVLGAPEVQKVIDFSAPVCVILGGTLSNMSVTAARRTVKGYAEALAPGSAVIITCAWFADEEFAARIAGMFEPAGDWRNRSREDVASFFAAGGLAIPQGQVGDVRAWPLFCDSQNRTAAILGGVGLKVGAGSNSNNGLDPAQHGLDLT